MSLTYKVHVTIPRLVEGEDGGIFIPKNPELWAAGMESLLHTENVISMSVCSTDHPETAFVGFAPVELPSNPDIQDLGREGKAFGFYVNRSLAREFLKVFAMIAEAKDP